MNVCSNILFNPPPPPLLFFCFCFVFCSWSHCPDWDACAHVWVWVGVEGGCVCVWGGGGGGRLKNLWAAWPLIIVISIIITLLGQIQGDSRKFLDRFKSYFGSQISSQSLNEVHIYRLQPKSSLKKGDFFHIFLSLIVSSSRCMLPIDVWPSFPVTTWMLP